MVGPHAGRARFVPCLQLGCMYSQLCRECVVSVVVSRLMSWLVHCHLLPKAKRHAHVPWREHGAWTMEQKMLPIV